MSSNSPKALEDLINAWKQGISKDDFVKLATELAKLVAQGEKKVLEASNARLNQKMKEIESYVSGEVARQNRSTLATLRQRSLDAINILFDRMRLQDRIRSIEEDYSAKVNELNAKILEIPDAESLVRETALLVPKDTAQEERDRLESLQGDERLDASAIKGLEDFMKTGKTMWAGARRGAIKNYDLSDSLDGSTKTFTLPAFWNVFDVVAGSKPYALRPIIDYTVDASVPSITFTGEIDETTTLAAGQTVVVKYEEN